MTTRTKIYFTNETEQRVPRKVRTLIKRAVVSSLEHEGFCNSAEVSVTFTDNEGIRALNSQYRGIDKETDVLSVPLTDFEGGEQPPIDEQTVSLGDIVISLDKAREQAAEFGHSFERECAFLCAHSTLHLLGYDHELSDEDDADMRRRQHDIMDRMGLSIG